jgi:hypothetical protein
MTIYENLRTDRHYSSSTGLSRGKFEELSIEFCKHYRPKKHKLTSGEKPHFHDGREALFFILFYLKNYPTLQVLGLQFGVSDFTADTYIKYTMPYLKLALAAKSALAHRVFGSQEEFDKVFEGIADIIVDGTEVPVERADNHGEQKAAYSGKKKPTR